MTDQRRDESQAEATCDLSIVVPIFEEEENLEILHGEIAAVLDELDFESEVIYIDDGSKDRSPEILTELHKRDERVRVIRFRRNFGQTPAMAAGFEHARGKVVITMDGDLQNDPADIPRLLNALDEGYDIAAGWRKDRQDAWLSRRLPSIIANRMMASLSGVSIHDSGCTLKAFRMQVVKNLLLYAELHRFIPAMATTTGARVCEIVVNHRERRFGQSKYGIMRTVRVLFDLMTVKMLVQFASRPLHWFALLSLPFLFIAVTFLIIGMVEFGTAGSWRLVSSHDFRIPFPAAGLLFGMLAVELMLLGLLGELVVKMSGVHKRVILESIVSEVR